jgi:cephalosporin-C deacetylase-like acetyl esterase
MKVYIKKGLIIFLILILVAALGAVCSSCNKENAGTKTITLVIGEGETQKVFSLYKTDAEYLVDVLIELKEDGKITYTAKDSTYGAFLTEINGISPAIDNYICIFTTVSEFQDITDWKVEKSYEEATYVSAIFGINDLKIIDGAGYMITLV